MNVRTQVTVTIKKLPQKVGNNTDTLIHNRTLCLAVYKLLDRRHKLNDGRVVQRLANQLTELYSRIV
jgi:hypothetical protein